MSEIRGYRADIITQDWWEGMDPPNQEGGKSEESWFRLGKELSKIMEHILVGRGGGAGNMKVFWLKDGNNEHDYTLFIDIPIKTNATSNNGLVMLHTDKGHVEETMKVMSEGNRDMIDDYLRGLLELLKLAMT